MNRPSAAGRARTAASLGLTLVLAVAAAGCDTGVVTPAPGSPGANVAGPSGPTASSAPSAMPQTPSPVPTGPAVQPTASPAVVATPADLAALAPGALAVTVTDDLRVRSQPRVADDSLKLTPLLPKGTQLVIIDGPVQASGFTWLEVAPIDAPLDGGVDAGWVATADHDGTAWVAPATDPTPGYELASVEATRPAPGLAQAKAAAIAQNAFGIALYRRLLRDPELGLSSRGVAMSPYSIATALAMARAGAAGDTANQMDAVLRVKGWDRLGAGLNALDQRLASRDAAWVGDEDSQHWLALRTANTAFGQRDYAIKAAYLERIAATFGAGLGLVDFVKDTEGARTAINAWVSRQTLGRIPALLQPDDLTDLTRIVLVNAVYLKAEWARPFEPEVTKDRAFTTLAGKVVKAPTMMQTGDQDIVLASGKGWRATELRYLGANDSRPLAMTLILPDNLPAFERSMTPATLKAVQATITTEGKRLQQVTYPKGEQDSCGWFPYDVALYLPRFGVETRASLKTSLEALGMPDAFDAARADFSGLTDDGSFYVGAVIHQANIDVDEQGTTASAATAVIGMTGGCLGPQARKTRALHFDKPFLYVIRDVQTGAILFMGRVVDPTAR